MNSGAGRGLGYSREHCLLYIRSAAATATDNEEQVMNDLGLKEGKSRNRTDDLA